MSSCSGTYRVIGNYARLSSACNCTSDANSCCADPIQTSGVIYSGANLACTGINTCDTMDVVLQKLDAKLCEINQAILDLAELI